VGIEAANLPLGNEDIVHVWGKSGDSTYNGKHYYT